jgi:hypothetical protein
MVNQNPYVDPWPSPAVGTAAVVLVGIDCARQHRQIAPGAGFRVDEIDRVPDEYDAIWSAADRAEIS